MAFRFQISKKKISFLSLVPLFVLMTETWEKREKRGNNSMQTVYRYQCDIRWHFFFLNSFREHSIVVDLIKCAVIFLTIRWYILC